MSNFVITAPNGQKFKITAPEGATAEQAMQAFQKSMEGQEPAAPAPQEEWERAVLLPMETNKTSGERRWAVPGFIDAAISAAALPGDVATGKTELDPRVSYADQNPETLDRAATLAGGVGAELPLAARGMVPQTARNLVDASGSAMPRMVADELERANIAPAALQPKLDALGPAGIVGDLTPRLQARVGAIATSPGPGQDMVVEALRARQLGANPRIKSAIEQNLGPDPVPSQVRADIDADRVAANANYPPVLREKALSEDFLYDAQPLAEALSREVPNFVGNTRSQIEAVRKMLVNPQTGELTNDPQIILAVRHELDGVIGEMKKGGGNTTTIKALGDMRKMIDDDLARQVPGIKAADAIRAEVHGQTEAFDLGRTLFKGGDEPLHPADLAAKAGELQGKGALRLSQGTLTKIYEAVGTTANDRVALGQFLKGVGSWNREKITTVFGKEKADALIKLLDAEAQMATTENLAFGNSKTEVLRSAKEGIVQEKGGPGVIRSALNLQVGDAIAKAGDKVLGGAFQNAATRRNAAIAEALLSQGGWRPGRVAASSNPGLVPLSNVAVIEALIEQGKRGGMLTGGGF